MKYSIIVLVLISLGIFGTSQKTTSNDDLEYNVNRLRAPLSVEKETLDKANTLVDLNRNYKSSWVREYKSVEISAIHKGKVRKAVSNNDVLSQEQKNIMYKADLGTEISVKMLYIPENTLKNNGVKEYSFEFLVNPKNEATYIGGQAKLEQYLKQYAIDKIPHDVFQGYDLAVVKFVVTEKGQITNARILETSKDEKTDQLLLKVISNMPKWKPAEYTNGTKAKQEFVLTVGNHENCMIYLYKSPED